MSTRKKERRSRDGIRHEGSDMPGCALAATAVCTQWLLPCVQLCM